MAQTLPGVTISGPSPWLDVKAYGAKGDGVADDSTAINNAISACPDRGCTVYFGAGNTYLILSGLSIPASKQGIRLLGECGAPGTHNAPNVETCSHIVTTTDIPFVMLTVGVANNKLRGLEIQDLGFQDKGMNRTVTGAIRLVDVESFNLTNVHCRGIEKGYCFLFDGGGTGPEDFTQFGVVVNPDVGDTKFPVQTNFQVSEINFFGGNLGCNNILGSIGMDLGFTNHIDNFVSDRRRVGRLRHPYPELQDRHLHVQQLQHELLRDHGADPR